MPDELCNCQRCGVRCRVVARRNPAAKMLRFASQPKGFCVNCAATEWLLNAYPVNMIIDESPLGPKMLLHPHIQEQFAAIMQVGQADANPAEINWQLVVQNWDLPWPKRTGRTRSATNPYVPERDLDPRIRAASKPDEPPSPTQSSLL